jgi:Family of unknown function (DUF6221)
MSELPEFLAGMALPEFLWARLDEDEADARERDRHSDELGAGADFGTGPGALGMIAAIRAILFRYADCLARMEDPDYPAGVAKDQAREYEDFVLPNLAAAWNGYPDYDQDWAP